VEELRLSGYREPLGLWLRRVPPPERAPDVRAYRIEYSSRGDRVPGRLWLPRNPGGECPLVSFQPAGSGEAELSALDEILSGWVARGVAVASIDLPLRGERTDPKLSALVGTPFQPGTLENAEPLRFELARQAVIDLERALDALCTLDEIDRDQIAFVGLGLGAMIGAAFCALDPRPRGAALAGAGAGLAEPSIDPGSYLGRFAPRPLLLLNAEDGEVPRAAAAALARAAGESCEQRWLAASDDLAATLATIWTFLETLLGLPSPARS
jgi:dienelactone hydrolase